MPSGGVHTIKMPSERIFGSAVPSDYYNLVIFFETRGRNRPSV